MNSPFCNFFRKSGARATIAVAPGKIEREMEEEMRFHLEMQIKQNLDAGTGDEGMGVTPPGGDSGIKPG